MLAVALVLAVTACSPRVQPGAAASTRVPALTAHEWKQSEPLISMGYIPADAGCGFDAQLPADLTLLPDGRLYRLDVPTGQLKRQIKTATLSMQETCKLLNSIDHAGFFDYDPATYIVNPDQWTPPVLWAPTNTIAVKAWRSKAVSLYWLDGFVNGSEQMQAAQQFPTVLPALRNTYNLLTQYEPSYSQIQQWERIGVWMDSNVQNGDAVDWPIDAFPASVPNVTEAGAQPSLILVQADAMAVYDLFDQRMDTCGITILHDRSYYRAFARPLLPNEYPPAPLPAVSLSCSPADGLLEMP